MVYLFFWILDLYHALHIYICAFLYIYIRLLLFLYLPTFFEFCIQIVCVQV